MDDSLGEDIDALVAVGRRRSGLPAPAERRRIREEAGLTQAAVGAGCGVERTTVARWERGERSPTGEPRERYIELLRRLAEVQGAA